MHLKKIYRNFRHFIAIKISNFAAQEEEHLSNDGWVVSSESCAFLTMTEYVREILPGEIVEISKSGIKTVDRVETPEGKKLAFCIFEYVYFARPNSIFEGQEVYSVRAQCGVQLAKEHPVEADLVGSVPESGNAAAYGFSKEVFKKAFLLTNFLFLLLTYFYFL